MPHSTPEPGGEGGGLWLPLIEYSVRSGLSLSTIRRKIKSNSIRFRLEKGRYLILSDGAVDFEPVERERMAPISKDDTNRDERWALPLIEKAVEMVSEAFEHVLKEKDERIRLLEKRSNELEERAHELHLLVRMLEEKFAVRY